MTARLTGIMTGIMNGITTGVAAGVKLVFTTVELDCVSTHLHQTYSRAGMLVLNIPLHWVLLGHFKKLFIIGVIQCCIRQSNFVYTSCHRPSLLIPVVINFLVYTSSVINYFVYTSHYSFIEYTSAPVEVSVWLGGTTLKSVYGAFCVQDAVQVE